MKALTATTNASEQLGNSNFYFIQAEWKEKDICREYTDDASRTFTTILTSGDNCSYFDVDGNPVSKEQFTSRYNNYSGEKFLVIMNTKTGQFIIKPNAVGIRKVRTSIQKYRYKINYRLGRGKEVA